MSSPHSVHAADHAPLVFDRRGIQAVDREAVEKYGVPGIVLMENAAIGLAAHAQELLGAAGGSAIICGPGNNGGDGYALARHLHNAGVTVHLASMSEPRDGSDAAINRAICAAMGVPALSLERCRALGPVDLIVDALFGTGLQRPLEGEALEWVRWINGRAERVLAVDVPSGLDSNSGAVLGAAVEADRTVTMAGWKQGFLSLEAQKHLGEVAVVPIGAPVELYHAHGRPAPAPVPDEQGPRQLSSRGPRGR